MRVRDERETVLLYTRLDTSGQNRHSSKVNVRFQDFFFTLATSLFQLIINLEMAYPAGIIIKLFISACAY